MMGSLGLSLESWDIGFDVVVRGMIFHQKIEDAVAGVEPAEFFTVDDVDCMTLAVVAVAAAKPPARRLVFDFSIAVDTSSRWIRNHEVNCKPGVDLHSSSSSGGGVPAVRPAAARAFSRCIKVG